MRHVYLVWGAIILLALACVYSVQTGISAREHQNDALSAIICHAEHLVKTSKGLTQEQRQQALRFYERQIVLEHLKPCTD